MQRSNGGSRDGPIRDGPRRDGNRSFSGSRDGSRGGGNFGQRRDFGGPKEMHKAVCSDCGQECEVPFKPIEGKPVYCRDCFRKSKSY